jgi:hypothetical protein
MWVIVIPPTLLTHMAVGKIIPAIGDLPLNLVDGFEVVFGFRQLEPDAANIRKETSAVMQQCGIPGDTSCDPDTLTNVLANNGKYNDQVNVVAARDAIQRPFQPGGSLYKTLKVTGDKYLGTEAFQTTHEGLMEVKDALLKFTDSGDTLSCTEAVVQMCGGYEGSKMIMDAHYQVEGELDKFRNSEEITIWENNKGILSFLHALPYTLIIGMLTFTLFWWKGGICCCCKEGTCLGWILVPLYVILWLLSFVIWTIIFISGVAFRVASERQEAALTMLQGSPTIKEFIDHLQTEYPQFWETVFADLAEGLGNLLPAAALFWVVCVFIGLYSCCECCCSPYRSDKIGGKLAADPPAVQGAVQGEIIQQPNSA